MNCPKCDHHLNSVIDSRPMRKEAAIRRRRSCLKCKVRFTTYETMMHPNEQRRAKLIRYKLRKFLARMQAELES